MKFIHLDDGTIYCWWGKSLSIPITPLSAAVSMLKGERLVDMTNDWFLVFDPKNVQGKCVP